MMMQHDDPRAGVRDDVRVLLAVGVGGGLFVDYGLGADLRVTAQTAESNALGANLGAGFNLADRSELEPGHPLLSRPRWLWALRGFDRWNPKGLDWQVVESGAGLTGTDRGMVAVTADSALTFGHSFTTGAVRLPFYGGPSLALSVPLRDGDPIQVARLFSQTDLQDVVSEPTLYIGGGYGVGAEAASPTSHGGTLEVTSHVGLTESGSALLFSLSGATGFDKAR
jgi:hypothetical protein